MAKKYEGLMKDKETQAENVAIQTCQFEAGGTGSGLHHPHAYLGRRNDDTISAYFYGTFLVAVPMYTSGEYGGSSCSKSNANICRSVANLHDR